MNRTQARARVEELLAWKRGSLVGGRCVKCEAFGAPSGRTIDVPPGIVDEFDGLPVHALVFPHADDCPLADVNKTAEEILSLCQRFGFALEQVPEQPIKVRGEVAAVFSLRLVDDA